MPALKKRLKTFARTLFRPNPSPPQEHRQPNQGRDNGIICLSNGMYTMTGRLVFDDVNPDVLRTITTILDTGCENNIMAQSCAIDIFGLNPDMSTGQNLLIAFGGAEIPGVKYTARFFREGEVKSFTIDLFIVKDAGEYEMVIGSKSLRDMGIGLSGPTSKIKLAGHGGTRVATPNHELAVINDAERQQQQAITESDAKKEQRDREKRAKRAKVKQAGSQTGSQTGS